MAYLALLAFFAVIYYSVFLISRGYRILFKNETELVKGYLNVSESKLPELSKAHAKIMLYFGIFLLLITAISLIIRLPLSIYGIVISGPAVMVTTRITGLRKKYCENN